MLAAAIRARARSGDTVLDPFTGSGVLAIAAAMEGACATAIDVSRRAVLCASLNARLNGTRLEVVRAESMAPLGERRFDWIVANPPYVPGPDTEPHGPARAWEGGPDGRRFIDRLCREAPRRLAPGGGLLLIHSSFCGEEETLSLLRGQGLEAHVVERQAGDLGPLMAERIDRLRALGYDAERQGEELLIFEAVRSTELRSELRQIAGSARRAHS